MMKLEKKHLYIVGVLIGVTMLIFPTSIINALGYTPEYSLSDNAVYLRDYKGYEIWKDTETFEDPIWIVETPSGVVPKVSTWRKSIESAKSAIDKALEEYNSPPPTNTDPGPVDPPIITDPNPLDEDPPITDSDDTINDAVDPKFGKQFNPIFVQVPGLGLAIGSAIAYKREDE